METEEVVFIRGRLSRAGIPAERVFHIAAPNGGRYVGIAPVGYCYSGDKRPLRAEPLGQEQVPGYVLGLALGSPGAGDVRRVYLPDGEVYEISHELIEEKVEDARVPLRS